MIPKENMRSEMINIQINDCLGKSNGNVWWGLHVQRQ